MTVTGAEEALREALPPYDGLVADVFRDYLKELVGWEDVDRWASLPATWRWYEFWERLSAALASHPAASDGELQRAKDRYANLAIGLEEIRDADWPGDNAVDRIRQCADRWLSGAEEDLDTRMRAALTAKQSPTPLPADVRRLVIAARIVSFTDQSREAFNELDAASEAFADRVPWGKL